MFGLPSAQQQDEEFRREIEARMMRRYEAQQLGLSGADLERATVDPGFLAERKASAASEKDAAASRTAVQEQTQANRVDRYTPQGSEQWTQGPDGRWTQRVSLSPDAQRAYDATSGLNADRAQTARGMFGLAAEAYRQPFSLAGLPDAPDAQRARDQAYQAAYGQAASRLDPAFEQRGDALRSRLYNQGLREGDKAFDTQMANFGRDRNDAYQGAMNAAFGLSTQAGESLFNLGRTQRQDALSERLTARDRPFYEANALASGAAPAMPNFTPFAMSGAAQSPNYSGAMQFGMDYGMRQQEAEAKRRQAAQQQGDNEFGDWLSLGKSIAAL